VPRAPTTPLERWAPLETTTPLLRAVRWGVGMSRSGRAGSRSHQSHLLQRTLPLPLPLRLSLRRGVTLVPLQLSCHCQPSQLEFIHHQFNFMFECASKITSSADAGTSGRPFAAAPAAAAAAAAAASKGRGYALVKRKVLKIFDGMPFGGVVTKYFPRQGLTLVPISAQLELFCPPCNPTYDMNVSRICVT